MTTDFSAIGPDRPAAAQASPAAPTAAKPASGPKPAELDSASSQESAKADFEPTISSEEMRENLREAIKRLNEMMRQNSRDLNFSMDETTDRVVITVKNANTGEVVRQIPDATLLRVAHNLENLKGVLHNQTI